MDESMEGLGDDANDMESQVEHLEGQDSKRRMHRSLPRVKMILEDETYLSGILNVLESTECYKQPVAAVNNQWNLAFHNIYGTVAADCHMPQGKNRHHKFKEKIIELWYAIEREVRDPINPKSTESHPYHALGMKQLAEYRSVARSSDRKRPPGPPVLPSVLDAAIARNNAIAAAAPMKKGRFETAYAEAAQGYSGFGSFPPVPPTSTEAILTQMQINLKRIENIASFSTGPPKLPSPLSELHRIIIGGMLDDPTNKQLLTPYYNKCLAAFLRVAQEQADNAVTSSLLPGVLEGLEILMRHDGHDENMKKGLQYTYNYVLKAYLKLIEPQVKRNNSTAHAGLHGTNI